MKFNIHRSFHKTEYFLDSLITRKSLTLLNFLVNYVRNATYRGKLELKIALNMKIYNAYRFLQIIYRNIEFHIQMYTKFTDIPNNSYY